MAWDRIDGSGLVKFGTENRFQAVPVSFIFKFY